MCFIAVCLEGMALDEKEIKLAASQNPDGIGIAWQDDGVVKYKKGLTVESLMPIYDDLDGRTHIVHFRLATVGGKIKTLTHPFPCSLEQTNAIEGSFNDGLLFHNGHTSDWRQEMRSFVMQNNYHISEDVVWSDSRVIAVLVAKHGHPLLQFVEGRYAVMFPKTIKTYGMWEQNKGRWFSSDLRKTTYCYRGGSWNAKKGVWEENYRDY